MRDVYYIEQRVGPHSQSYRDFASGGATHRKLSRRVIRTPCTIHYASRRSTRLAPAVYGAPSALDSSLVNDHNHPLFRNRDIYPPVPDKVTLL